LTVRSFFVVRGRTCAFVWMRGLIDQWASCTPEYFIPLDDIFLNHVIIIFSQSCYSNWILSFRR